MKFFHAAEVPRALRRWLGGAISLLVMGAVGLFGGYPAWLNVTGNFGVVVPGECYRSAQVTPESLANIVASYHIKTVVNLRGENAKQDWYRDEVQAARRLGLTLVNHRLSARRDWTDLEVESLAQSFQNAEKPILIHCKAGSDRTGMASALYLAMKRGRVDTVVDRELSFRYGHFSLPFFSEYAMNRELQQLKDRLNTTPGNSPSSASGAQRGMGAGRMTF